MKTKPTKVYIIRHGETDNNVLHRFQGSTDVPLSERGLCQARCLKAPMSRLHLDAIYSSPYRRSMQTMEQVRGDRNMKIITDKGLCEIYCGKWEGLNREEIQKKWPGMIDLWQYEPEKLHMPDGETFAEVQDRATKALIRIVNRERGHCIAVGSHMLTIQLIMAKLLGIPIHEVWNMWRLENTSVTTLDIDENGDFEILKWGDDSHLPDALKNPYVRIAGFVQKNFKAAYDMGEAEGKRHYEGFVLANGPHGMQGREPYIPVVAKPS